MLNKKALQIGCLCLAGLFATPSTADFFDFFAIDPVTTSIDSQVKILSEKAPALNPNVLKLGLQAYLKAKQQGLVSHDLLTIVDYSKPSSAARLWVFDLKRNDILFQERVAHGKNSGPGEMATSFSNEARSLKSSLGVYVTKGTYVGNHGYSMRVVGLERGINDMAAPRAIVFHAAAYVRERVAGHSWGCFALRPEITQSVINTIKDGSVVFAYHPDWVSRSRFLS